jgi:hypothetical protein
MGKKVNKKFKAEPTMFRYRPLSLLNNREVTTGDFLCFWRDRKNLR